MYNCNKKDLGGFLYDLLTTDFEIPIYERTPDSLIMGLSKIGGLIALFKLASLLQFYHKSKFEKEYANDNQVASDDEKN